MLLQNRYSYNYTLNLQSQEVVIPDTSPSAISIAMMRVTAFYNVAGHTAAVQSELYNDYYLTTKCYDLYIHLCKSTHALHAPCTKTNEVSYQLVFLIGLLP